MSTQHQFNPEYPFNPEQPFVPIRPFDPLQPLDPQRSFNPMQPFNPEQPINPEQPFAPELIARPQSMRDMQQPSPDVIRTLVISQGVMNGARRFASQTWIAGLLEQLFLKHDPSGMLLQIEPVQALLQLHQYSNTLNETVALIKNVSAERSTAMNWHPRALLVFSESIALGSLSRAHYNEADILKVEDIIQYMGIFEIILNGFIHIGRD